jgi:membrane protein YdbS with pleckstrin-like domain
MYKFFRKIAERLLRIPPQPGTPPGDEASTRVFRAAPNYFKYLVVFWGLKTTAVVLPILVLATGFLALSYTVDRQSLRDAPLIVTIFVVVLASCLVRRLFRLAVLRLDYEKRWYVVTDRSLRVREGVVGVQEITVTFANIQNLTISQGPIQRFLGVADLRVDTAGGGGATHPAHGDDLHTAWFRGIDNADEVRQLIQQRLRRLKDSGLGDHEELRAEATSPRNDLTAALREVYRETAALRAAVATET